MSKVRDYFSAKDKYYQKPLSFRARARSIRLGNTSIKDAQKHDEFFKKSLMNENIEKP